MLLRDSILTACLLLTFLGACGADEPVVSEPLPDLPPVVEDLRPRGPEAEVRELTLALSAELRGEIEPCGCPTLPYGGFRRRATLLSQLDAREGPLFQIDTGEAFKKGLVHDDNVDLPRALLIAELLVSAGVDAFVPGPTDVAVLGVDGLAGLSRKGLPIVSATWVDEDGASLFPPAIVLEDDGVRVGVIGISAPADDVEQRAPIEAARAAYAGLPTDLDLVVLATNLDESLVDEVTAAVDGIALVAARSGNATEPMRRVDGAMVLEPPPRGRYLSVVSLRLGSDADEALDDESARAYLGLVDLRQVKARRLAAGEDVTAQDERIAEATERLLEAGRGRNLVSLESRPLGSDLDADSPLAERVERFKDESLQAAARRVEATPENDGPTYATAAACLNCHSRSLSKWSLTRHAQALEGLRERGQHENPECLACHTTGFGEPGGFAEVTNAALRVWGNVQCEACHGPMGGHPRDDTVVSPEVTEATCRGCHDQANSPGFDFATYLPAIEHVGMDQ
ncbi:MAG TPA: multiheme c-type cytochrome [Myxococcota bacterium]|nr:multiheme c-type cytochrome [Myxococcota bacterium]